MFGIGCPLYPLSTPSAVSWVANSTYAYPSEVPVVLLRATLALTSCPVAASPDKCQPQKE